MGLFSKKTCTCQQCGKKYETRLDIGSHLCSECQQAKKKAMAVVSGYVEYGQRAGKTYNMDELHAIAAHRDSILEKYRNADSLEKEAWAEAGNNYKKLSESEAVNIYTMALKSSLFCTLGTASSSNFFCLTGYEGVVVDESDVFAVGYTQDIKSSTTTRETILCAVFTNDPYIPVFPAVHSGNIGMLSLSFKSKRGRQGVEAIYTHDCPNLVWPVSDLKNLKKNG